MRWSSFIERLWIAKMPADHAWRTITEVKWNETKWMRWVWINGGMNFMTGENRRNPEKTYLTPFRPPRNPHGVTLMRTRDLSVGRRASNSLRHRSALKIWWKNFHKTEFCLNECRFENVTDTMNVWKTYNLIKF